MDSIYIKDVKKLCPRHNSQACIQSKQQDSQTITVDDFLRGRIKQKPIQLAVQLSLRRRRSWDIIPPDPVHSSLKSVIRWNFREEQVLGPRILASKGSFLINFGHIIRAMRAEYPRQECTHHALGPYQASPSQQPQEDDG
jgi:hypothetical protein